MKTISAFSFDVKSNDLLPENFPEYMLNKHGPTRLIAFSDIEPSLALYKAKIAMKTFLAMNNVRKRTQCKCVPNLEKTYKICDWFISKPENQPNEISRLSVITIKHTGTFNNVRTVKKFKEIR